MIARLPASLEPFYRHNRPDQPIGLYRGRIKLEYSGWVRELSGVVTVEWRPKPAIFYQGTTVGRVDPTRLFSEFQEEPKVVTLPHMDAGVPPQLRDHRPRRPSTSHHSGERVNRLPSVEFGGDSRLRRVVFGIVNLNDLRGRTVRSGTGLRAHRLVLQSGQWRIVVDGSPDSAALVKGLERQGGYAITHTAQLDRADGREFTTRQAATLIDGLTIFLWFVRGLRASPLLPVGFDAADHPVWSRWEMRSLDRWANPFSWVDSLEGSAGVEEVFPGFFRLWGSPLWRETLILAINYYMSANTPSTVNSGVVDAQVALELLAWTSLVEDKQLMPEQKFKPPFSGTLRLLLKEAKIDLNIPLNLPSLKRAAARRGWADGPHALTSLRNEVVHLHIRSRAQFGVWVDAWRLGVWYLELVLLRLMDYDGQYSSRLRPNPWVGQVESVPWA